MGLSGEGHSDANNPAGSDDHEDDAESSKGLRKNEDDPPPECECSRGEPPKGMLSLAASHRNAINKRAAPRPIRRKPVLLIIHGLTFE
jgi:hypothetical protein